MAELKVANTYSNH